MSSPLRLGLVGYGRLAEAYYSPALRRLAAVELAAVADPLAARRRRAGADWPAARLYSDCAALLAAGGLDALLVASPPSTHLAGWRAASAARLPAFIEKPLVLTHELGVLDGSESRERVMVDFNRHFWAPYRRVRERIANGDLGAPLTLELELHLDLRPWSHVTAHRAEPAEGGVLHDLGSHALDLACWMLGAPRELRAETSADDPSGRRFRLELLFADGSRAALDVAHGRRTAERLRARGPRGRLWLDDPNRALHFEPRGESRSRTIALALDAVVFVGRALRRSTSGGRASIEAALARFVAGVRSGGPFAPGAAEGLRNVELVAAALRSAAAGGTDVAL